MISVKRILQHVFAILFAVEVCGQQGEPPQTILSFNFDRPTALVRSVRFSNDGTLYSAGDDKVARRWEFLENRSLLTKQVYRWPINVGNYGVIYAMAVSPNGKQMAVAGQGYSGGVGEIAQFALPTGKLEWIETNGHALTTDQNRRAVWALEYSPDGKWLVSRDASGRILARPAAGTPQPPRELAPSLAKPAEFMKFAISGTDVIYSVPLNRVEAGSELWGLRAISLEQPTPASRALPGILRDGVTTLSAAAGRSVCVAGDFESPARLLIWQNFTSEPKSVPLGTSFGAISSAVNAEGTRVVAGTYSTSQPNERGKVVLFDLPSQQPLLQQDLTLPAWAVALSLTSDRIAYTEGNSVAVIYDMVNKKVLRAQGLPSIERVQFERGELKPGERHYPVRFQSRADGGTGALSRRFNLIEGRLESLPPDSSVSLPADNLNGWKVALGGANGAAFPVRITDPRGSLIVPNLRREIHGTPVSWRWIPSVGGQAPYLALGLSGSEYSIVIIEPLTGSLVRGFAGHQGPTLSMDLSPDGRYLVSGSSDGTIRFWNLDTLRDPAVLLQRWGANLQFKADQVFVTSIHDPGPLFDKGIRSGDRLLEIRWKEAGTGKLLVERESQKIIAKLNALPIDEKIAFAFERNGQALPVVQTRGWNDTVAVLIADQDWIAWNPVGYYTCTAAGEDFIGWLLNGPVGTAPEYFGAERFHQTLYRPKAIPKLLQTGRLLTSLVEPQVKVLPQLPPVVVEPKPIAAILPPTVELLDLSQETLKIPTSVFTFNAQATAPPDSLPITKMKLLIDGRAPREHIRAIPSLRQAKVSWTVSLEPGSYDLEIEAETSGSNAKSRRVRVEFLPEMKKSRLFVLTVGISRYLAPDSLLFAHSDAQLISNQFKKYAGGIYDEVKVLTPLTDALATKAEILAAIETMNSQLTLSDVGVIFFAGHGVTDANDEFYFYPYDGKKDNIQQSFLSQSEIVDALQNSPGKGRLLLLMDACYSGNVNLDKFAVKLSHNAIVLISSCANNQQSYEDVKWQAGAFTKALAKGLAGDADASYRGRPADGVIQLPELYDYVGKELAEMTAKKPHVQLPQMNMRYPPTYSLTRY